jgi:hypothetical protein
MFVGMAPGWNWFCVVTSDGFWYDVVEPAGYIIILVTW